MDVFTASPRTKTSTPARHDRNTARGVIQRTRREHSTCPSPPAVQGLNPLVTVTRPVPHAAAPVRALAVRPVPEAIGGRALRWVTLPLRYLYALLRDLGRGELGLRAMSLVYSTLFAIVPVIAVAFAVLKAFGYHRELEPVLFEFLRPLGEQGYTLTKNIMGFVENVQGTILGTVGFAFLLFTVVSMIQKIEESLNFVWHVERPRSLARRVSEYLVVMLIGPAIAVFAMVLLARVEASDALAQAVGPRHRRRGHARQRARHAVRDGRGAVRVRLPLHAEHRACASARRWSVRCSAACCGPPSARCSRASSCTPRRPRPSTPASRWCCCSWCGCT